MVARRGGADRQLAVCVGSRGPGICTLIKRLTLRGVAHHVWVLTIAVHIPLDGVGASYSQETRPQALFCECGVYCELLGTAEMARGASSRLRCAAVEERGSPSAGSWTERFSAHLHRKTAVPLAEGLGRLPDPRRCRAAHVGKSTGPSQG